MQGLTLEQLKKMGAQPVEKKGFTLSELKSQEPSYLEKIGSSFTSAVSDFGTNLGNFSKIPVKKILTNTPEQNKGILQPLAQTPLDAFSILGRPIGTALEPIFAPIGEFAAENLLSEQGRQKVGQAFTEFTTPKPNEFGYTGNLGKSILDASNVVGAGALAKGGVSVAKAGAKGIGTATTKGIEAVGGVLPERAGLSAAILNRELKLNPRTGANKFSEMSGGKSPGDYLVNKNIFGTREEIANSLAKDWAESYATKKQVLANIPNQFEFAPARDALEQLVDFTRKTATRESPGKFSDRIALLNQTALERGLTLGEIDEIKSIYENTVKLGHQKSLNSEGVTRSTNTDNALRTFIEKEADKLGVPNIKDLNKNTQLSRFLGEQIEDKIEGQAGNNFLSLTDYIIGGGAVIDPSALLVLGAKKALGSERAMGKMAEIIAPKQGLPKGVSQTSGSGSLNAGSTPSQVSANQLLQKSYTDTIPQKGALSSALDVENKTKIDNAYKLIYGEEAAAIKATDALKDELFGTSVVSKLDNEGKYAWETLKTGDDTVKYNQTFKSDVIDSTPQLKNFFDNTKGDDFVNSLSKEGIVPDVTKTLKTDTISYPPEAIKLIDKKIEELKTLVELPKEKIDISETAVKVVKKNPEIKAEVVKVLDDEKITIEDAVDMLRRIKGDEKLSSFYTQLKQDILSNLNRKQRANMDNLLNMERAKDFVNLVNEQPVKIKKSNQLTSFLEKNGGKVKETSSNLVSEEAYAKAKENFMKNMGRINSGIPVDQIKELVVMATYHAERGIKTAVELGKEFAKVGIELAKDQVEMLMKKSLGENKNIVNASKLPLDKIEKLKAFRNDFNLDTLKFSDKEVKRDLRQYLKDNDIDIRTANDEKLVDYIDEIIVRRELLRDVTARQSIPNE